MRRLVLAFALVVTLAAPARAVLIASGDGSGNTSPPVDDPGFGRVCVRLPGLSCVYLGNGWVLTANHVGPGPVLLGGVTYSFVASSRHQLQNLDSSYADVIVFRIDGEPNVPTVPIRASSPGMNNNLTLVGYGHDRGAPTTWNGFQGWAWDTSAKHMRWGTNRVGAITLDVTLGSTKTRSFASSFTGPTGATTHEAQAVVGDSGGGVFLKNGSVWELAGMMYAIDGYDGQPVNTSLFGNDSYFADLSYYRSQILGWASTPECNDGLDDDGDGLVDYPNDPGCKSSSDTHERFDCNDGFDNDADGVIDYPADAGCAGPFSDVENPQCNDGVDNDADSLVDLADPGCAYAYLSYETPPANCGLGPELAPILALLGMLRGRLARRTRR